MHLPQRCCTNISLRAHHDSFSNRTLIAIHQQEQTMKTRTLIAAMAVSAGLVLGPAALAQEETPVEMKDVPSPAQTTIQQHPPTPPLAPVPHHPPPATPSPH